MQTIGQYKIDIYRDETFTLGSSDNFQKYDFEYFDKSEYVFTTMVGIRVFKDENLLKSAIIGAVGGSTGIHKNSVIFEDAKIVICCSDSIFCLSIPSLTLCWQTQADEATCLEIFKYQDSYIVHGELEISKLDNNGKILWQFSGADTFTTVNRLGTINSVSPDFELTDRFIIVKDFEMRIYKVDYEGNDHTDKSQFWGL